MMYLADYRNRIRIDLSDLAEDLLADDVLDRALQRAVSDLSRFNPRSLAYEITLDFDVSAEAWTSAAAAGTYVQLANRYLKSQSEAVLNAAGAAMTRGTDYTIDYINGKITHISSGSIGDDEACTISYTKSKIGIDLNSIIDTMIRIEAVEYPYGEVPQSFVSYGIYNDDYLVIEGADESQEYMVSGKHVVVYYKGKHTVPELSAHGSYARFLDDTVILAASAYNLFTAAIKYNSEASENLDNAVSAVAEIATYLTATGVGEVSAMQDLAQIADVITAAETALAAVGTELTAGATPIGSIATELTAGVTPLAAVSTEAAAAKAYLETGDDLINTVNVGDNVPEMYRDYSTVLSNIGAIYERAAAERTARANTFRAEATERTARASAYRAEASERLTEVLDYIYKADRKLSVVGNIVSKIDRYIAITTNQLTISSRYQDEAIKRRDEAWAIWRDKGQWIGETSSTPVRQPTK